MIHISTQLILLDRLSWSIILNAAGHRRRNFRMNHLCWALYSIDKRKLTLRQRSPVTNTTRATQQRSLQSVASTRRLFAATSNRYRLTIGRIFSTFPVSKASQGVYIILHRDGEMLAPNIGPGNRTPLTINFERPPS